MLASFFLVWAGPCQANPDLGKTGPSPGAVLAAPGTGIVGDVNADGHRNILDLLRLLKHISGWLSYTQTADLDKNSAVNVYDLIILLKLLVPWHEQKEKFEFAMVLGHEILGSRISFFYVVDWQDCKDNPIPMPRKCTLRLYSNKPVEEFLLVFGEDTLTSPDDSLGYFYDPDTLQAKDRVKPLVFRIPWHLRLRVVDGSIIDSSGTTECEILFCQTIDDLLPFIGREIDFPLVIEGTPQRFTVFPKEYIFEDTLIIDLNPKESDIVIYPDIDSLVAALRPSLVEYIINKDGIPGGLGDIYFWPAKEVGSGRKTNRLALGAWNGAAYIVFPLDGNEELTDKLGFPGWLNREAVFVDLQYDILWE